MKFSSALTILAASGAASASILERQVQTIIGVVNGINTEVGSLDTAIKGFSGDPKPLTAASQKTLDTVNKGVETVNSASSITLTDSVQIQGQVQNLQSSLESVVSDLTAKKSELVAAGQGQVVYKNLEAQLTGAKALAAAISSKVPPEVKSLADTLSQGVVSALNKGVEAFKDAPGGSSTESSSSGSAAPASAPSAASGGASTSTTSSGSSAPAAAGGSSMSGSGMSGMSGSSSGSAAGAAGAAGAKPSSPTASAAPKPATYTGAAPRTVAGSFAVFVAAVVALAI